jgi:hypothetical protein
MLHVVKTRDVPGHCHGLASTRSQLRHHGRRCSLVVEIIHHHIRPLTPIGQRNRRANALLRASDQGHLPC